MRRLVERILLGTLEPRPWRRFAWLCLSFFSLFYLSAILSFVVLPDGFLRGRHPLVSSWTTAPDLWRSTLQIFGYNLMPTGVVVGGNLFASPSRLARGRLLPQGYLALWALAILTGAYLGSWSFEVVTPAPPFWQRLVRPLDIVHHSGFIELTGYILAATASARWARLRGRGLPADPALPGGPGLTPAERAFFLFALALIATGAWVESRAILEVTGNSLLLPPSGSPNP